MPEQKKKPGRPPLVQNERRHKTSVSLTRDQQIAFRRMGGSKWLQRTIEANLRGHL